MVHSRVEKCDKTTKWPPLMTTPIVSVAPIAGLPHKWAALDSGGSILIVDSASRTTIPQAQIELIREPDHEPWCDHALHPHIHVSPSGKYAAVVNDYGKRGLVAELATKRTTIAIHGGDYCSETVPFSLCFVSVAGRDLLIHRADWNRLDVSDPETGLLLTGRGPTSYKSNEDRPLHYLDYFHGRLHPSPGFTSVLDDGWIWHPIGVPSVWSLERWLSENVWESEDGPTRHELCGRNYYWDHPMTWIGNRRIALGGIGSDDNEITPGARIFELAAGGTWKEVFSFTGPDGPFFSNGSELFSADESGLSIWNPLSGMRIGHVADCRPQGMHPLSHEFLSYDGERLLIWKV